MEEIEYNPELKDILEMIHRYNASHKEGCFLFNFVGFKKDTENKCECCDDFTDTIDDTKSMVGAYGDLGMLRDMINMVRDIIEDGAEDDGFVNL